MKRAAATALKAPVAELRAMARTSRAAPLARCIPSALAVAVVVAVAAQQLLVAAVVALEVAAAAARAPVVLPAC